MGRKRIKFLETRIFGFVIGIVLFLFLVLVDSSTPIFSNLEQRMLDVHFRYRNLNINESKEAGVTSETENPNISQDILLIGIDFNSLTRLGKWPFPRFRHAHLLDSFGRIQDQNSRESAVFLDLFFIEPDNNAYDDVIFINSIQENGRVFLETVLDENPAPPASYNEFFDRQEVLFERYGKISSITGDWEAMDSFYGMQAPLKPYGQVVRGYGHANFREDIDDVYRRQPLIARSSRLVDSVPFEQLSEGFFLDRENYERLEWVDRYNRSHSIPYPLTRSVLENLERRLKKEAPLKMVDIDSDGIVDSSYYQIDKYRDSFVPSITLSLSLNHMNCKPEELEVVLGKYIRIPYPEQFNSEKGVWEPYTFLESPEKFDRDGNLVAEASYKTRDEILIPIDENGRMLINFMGPGSSTDSRGYRTFPVRSYSGYAANPPSLDPATWPKDKAVARKILMVGAFARGIAEDEKPTPFGMMYGVEIHANALNTILMNKFIIHAPYRVNILILFSLLFLSVLVTSRLKTIWSFIISILLILVYFFTTSIIFDIHSLVVDFSLPAFAVFSGFIIVVIYRVMTEEKDKKRIRNMFGKYVSPGVVDHLLENPPELGGVDKNITVFFSDVRGFTTLSESMTPQELLNHLNVYFTRMTDIILSYTGTLDKYVGDEIMCFWGAPLPQEDHALLACKCALEQSKALVDLNAGWPEEKRINIGIGLNSGIMTVGNVGSEGRMNYTLMGDPVNLGARLEGTNKQYGTQIIISEFTYGLVRDKVIVRELDNIRVKGKNKPVVIYELVDCV